ncbi:hypothetical protein BVG16_15760 [Paenibacillus selenitireducens]|uniref:Uncharacterized protein n=1 Tax=Paenibacillus selenitireducens TaxID=1324314 RepID=A0A1T2XAB3_9BACL|nr:hypothetical protein [Paenibacillus selenitireducens]OPA76636.1 hypothetical protein BVG16_15760 [Paenibacillus selenitireducens]
MSFGLTVFRAVLIFMNFVMLNFQPTTDTEIKIFFASRTVFFLMLVIDYACVAYYSKGLEKITSVVGLAFSAIFSIIDGAGVLGLLVLKHNASGYFITGNTQNFLTQLIIPFNANVYVLISWIVICAVLGFEVLNRGLRGISEKEPVNVPT